jgi:hypothetical protein
MILAGVLTYAAAWLAFPPGEPGPDRAGPSPTASAVINPAAGFVTVPGSSAPPTPLGPPPSDQLIQLVSFNKDAPPPLFGERAPWWTPAGNPRVPQITQFDGGRLSSPNSVMAAGAMLARLGYGIVTTGSQLGSLGPSRRAGNSLLDLEQALEDGWDATVGLAILTKDQLRAILAAGGGAVIIVDYGTIPAELHNQRGFSGAHALYVDAFREAVPGGSGGAYFIVDPIGEPWHGYQGDWWPADIVDRAAFEFGGDGIAAAWAFAGGIVPHGNYPPLPAESFPAGSPEVGSKLGIAIGASGPEVPSDAASYQDHDATQGGLDIVSDLGACLSSPAPAGCPPGIPAEYPSPKVAPPTVPPLAGTAPLDLLYTDVPQPGTWRTFIGGLNGAPADVEPTFSYWPANGSGPAVQVVPELVTLGGKQVWMVTVPIPHAGNFAFMASTVQAGVVTATDVGAISFGN